MIISHSKRFVLLLPWKAASQTAVARLSLYDDSPYPRFFYFNQQLKKVTHQHTIYSDYSRLPEKQLGYFEVAFVRNPYDRVYSGFGQLQRDLMMQPHAEFPAEWIRDQVMSQLSENLAQLTQASFDFNRWVSLIRKEQIEDAGRNSNFPLHPNHYWTHDKHEQGVDFVGRIENFETDFRTFVETVGLESTSQINQNVVSLVGGAETNPYGYRYVHHMSDDTIRKINIVFAEDFELFGYGQIQP
jgi:Sulfotransferase family